MTTKPEWWPVNPFQERSTLREPDDNQIFMGELGRIMWDLVSAQIWEAVKDHLEDECEEWFGGTE